MKKIYSLIGLLLLSAFLLAGEALNPTSAQLLGCGDLSNCCNSEFCSSTGTATGCTIKCASGATIQCPNKTKQC